MKNFTNDNGIAIFVSHRIDLKSRVIDNPMYHNMRCGAVFDEEENPEMPGDDTGDNISKLRIPFCELTVQYWAWKNYDAEYYGLCHYRRYMMFCDDMLNGDDYLLHTEKTLDSTAAGRLQLFNYSEMEKQIRSHDIIVGKSFDTTKITRIPPKKSVLDLWLASTNLVESKAIYMTIDIVREMFPDYAETMDEYLASRMYRGYNCYVMKKELFNKLCEFEYAVLFELYKRYDMTGFVGNMQRTPGYMGELLFGIFICHMEKLGYDIKENQIAFFEDTKVTSSKDKLVSYRRKERSPVQVVIPHANAKSSVALGNPAYLNIRCGAFSDMRKATNCPLGDNTGENISKLNPCLGILTAQYWAWKNLEAEHYGIVKPKFYFSLNGKSKANLIKENALNGEMVRKYSLDNQKQAEKLLGNADIVYPGAEPAEKFIDAFDGKKSQNAADSLRIHLKVGGNDVLDEVTAMIAELAPEYADSMNKYLESAQVMNFRGFVMNKDLFDKYNEFSFKVLFAYIERFDIEHRFGKDKDSAQFVADLLFGTFVTWAADNGSTVKTLPLVRFDVIKSKGSNIKAAKENRFKAWLKKTLKKIAYTLSPAYRVSLRNEKYLQALMESMTNGAGIGGSDLTRASSFKKNAWDNKTLTANIDLNIACLAQEIHDTHKASFSEFKDCHTDKSVVIVCSGPTMQYYTQIPNVAHIGVNSSFKREDIKLDYYFTTDYESRNPWFEDLKNYDFVKFFGQYSAGVFRDRFQVSEKLIRENNARRFFQGAPSEDIHLNIEYYPLMGFYSIAFQAIHFALYTNAKRIYLVGCDCSMAGYYDGSTQLLQANTPKWVSGYTKLREHVERFYPETEIISVNPDGLRGMFHDVYTKSFLEEHPEIDPDEVEILDIDLASRQG